MKKILSLTTCFLILTACGDDGSSDANPANVSEKSNVPNSKLSAFMTEEKVCDVLPVAKLKAMFKIEVDIQTQASGFAGSYTCNYRWEAKDKAAREAAMMNNIMTNAQGKGKKISLRERAVDHEVSITLNQSKKSAANFVPPILTQQQLDQQIENAKKAAAERLTDEQKEVAGDAAADMVAGLLKKNNQNEEVDGVGDAAYWSHVGIGGLYVLDRDVSVFISPMISSSAEVDKDYATQIFYQILNNL